MAKRRKRSRSVRPTTTLQQDLISASQRQVNIIWEHTQRNLAYSVVIGTIITDMLVGTGVLSVSSDFQMAALMQLNVMAGIVIGFYFGRTNHQRTGGVGGEDISRGR